MGVDLDAFFAENDMGGTCAYGTSPDFRSGFVSLVGRPNAGKSTLANELVCQKVAITSKCAQTTRRNISAVLSKDDFQIIFVDTPGIHKPHDALGQVLNDNAMGTFGDVDVVAMLIDASAPIGSGDEWVADRVRSSAAKKICVLSKCDLVGQNELATQIEAASKLVEWDALVALSAKTGKNTNALLEEIYHLLPKGPAWFPPDMQTDQSNEAMVAEFIREKIMRTFRDEIPHAVGVIVDEFGYSKKKDLFSIRATIYVERDSQKGMIIGKGGASIKRIGTEARKDLERLLDGKVFLDLNVKVKKMWRRDEEQIRRFGYINE